MKKEQIKEYFGKKIYVDGHGESLVYWFSDDDEKNIILIGDNGVYTLSIEEFNNKVYDNKIRKISCLKPFKEIFNDSLVKNYCKPIDKNINDVRAINKYALIVGNHVDRFIINDLPHGYTYGDFTIYESMEKKSSDYIRYRLLYTIINHYIDYMYDDGGEKLYNDIINVHIDNIDEKFYLEKIYDVVDGSKEDLEIINKMYDLVNNHIDKCIKIIDYCGQIDLLTYNTKVEAYNRFKDYFKYNRKKMKEQQYAIVSAFKELFENSKSTLEFDGEKYKLELVDYGNN